MSTRIVNRALLLFAAACMVMLVGPEMAEACAVCPLGSGRSGRAYLLTGLLITVTQVASLGTLVWWWRRRLLKDDAGDLTDRA